MYASLWVIPVIGYSFHHQRQSICQGFSRNHFLQKVSGRIVQFDKIKSSSSCQNGAAPKVISVFPILNDIEAFTYDVRTSVELAAEPRRSNMILLYDNE